MANSDKINTTDIKQLANGDFIDYADNDIVIIDDLRKFSKLQTIKVDFLLIIVVKSGRLAMRADKIEATASCNDIVICQPNTIMNECLLSIDFTAKAVCVSAQTARGMLHIGDVVDLSFYLKYRPIIHIDETSMGTFEKYHALLSEHLLKKISNTRSRLSAVLSVRFCFVCWASLRSQARSGLPLPCQAAVCCSNNS